ncbi:unnamed protein product [Amoebophrya sp. A120]|nr:unnamed protein product [Amoebophrya sp. A120]|eukprot:GSA120T00016418001.1
MNIFILMWPAGVPVEVPSYLCSRGRSTFWDSCVPIASIRLPRHVGFYSYWNPRHPVPPEADLACYTYTS